MSPLPERMADHWWWRPGCRPGRRQYVWHILLDDQGAVREAVRQVQERLEDVPGLDLVPERWLHITMHIVGFTDEISEVAAEGIAAEAARAVHVLAPVVVSFGRVLFHPEAVTLAVEPAPSLSPIREAVRGATIRVLGSEGADADGSWVPHVTAAYSNADGPAPPVIKAVGRTVTACAGTVRQVHLVAQERQGHL